MNPEQALAPQSAAESQAEKAPEKVIVSIPEMELTPEELTKLEKFLSELTGAEVNTDEKSDIEAKKPEPTPKVMSALALAEQAANDPHTSESQEPLAVRVKRGLLKKQETLLASMSATELAESGETIKAQIAELRKDLALNETKSTDPNIIDVEAKVIPESSAEATVIPKSGENLQIGYEKADKNEPPILTDKVGDAASMQVAQLQRDLSPDTNLKSSYEAAMDRMGATEATPNKAEGVKAEEGETKTEAVQEKTAETKPASEMVVVGEGVTLSQERGLATLEQISRAQELQTARLKGNLLERGLSKLEKSSTLEAYRNMNWKKKVALGVLMGTAGAAAMGTGAAPAALAAGLAFRGLGMASVYTGFIERTRIKKNEGQQVVDIGSDGKIEITNNDRLKALGLTALVGLLLPQAIKEGLVTVAETEVGQNVIGYAGDKITTLGEKISSLKAIFGEKPVIAAQAASPEEIITEAADPSTAPAAAAPEVAAALAGKVLSTKVEAGDTAYSVLRRMVPDIDTLDGATRQNNAIENILAKMKAHPGGLAAFGISSGNINELKPGESIDVAKIQSILDTAKMSSGKGILEHAASLSDDTVRRIASFSQPATNTPEASDAGVGPLGREDTVTTFPNSAAPDTTHAEDGGVRQTAEPQRGVAIPADALPADADPAAAVNTGAQGGSATAAVPLPEGVPAAAPAPLPEGTSSVATTPLPEAAVPTPTRLPEAPLPTAATAHSFNLNQPQLQALNAKQDQMILDAFYKTGSIRQNQGVIRNIFTGLFGTGNGAGAGRQAVEQIGTRIGQNAMSAQELAAAKAEWLKVKDIPASQIMSSNTPGPLNALKTKLENLSMGVLPQPQAGQSFDNYMRNILANAIKQGRSINV